MGVRLYQFVSTWTSVVARFPVSVAVTSLSRKLTLFRLVFPY